MPGTRNRATATHRAANTDRPSLQHKRLAQRSYAHFAAGTCSTPVSDRAIHRTKTKETAADKTRRPFRTGRFMDDPRLELPNKTLDRMTRSAVGRMFHCGRPWRAP